MIEVVTEGAALSWADARGRSRDVSEGCEGAASTSSAAKNEFSRRIHGDEGKKRRRRKREIRDEN